MPNKTCENCRHWTELGFERGQCELSKTQNKETLARAVPFKTTKHGDKLDYNGLAILVTSKDFSCSCFESPEV